MTLSVRQGNSRLTPMARFAFCRSGSYSRVFVLLVLMFAGTASAEGEQSKEVKADNAQPAIKLENSADSLAILQQSIATKREQLREINEVLKRKTDPTEKLEAEQKITRLSNEISSLQKSFEHIALGGINQSVLADQPEQKINWKDELEQISRPIVSTLKELTAKPRQMDALRRDIERYEKQLEEIDKALETLRLFRER